MGNQLILGTSGADTLTAIGDVTVDAGAGNDLIQSTLASSLTVRLLTGSGSDTVKFEAAAAAGASYPVKTVEIDASIFAEDVVVSGAPVYLADGTATETNRVRLSVYGLTSTDSLYFYDPALWQLKYLSDGTVSRPSVSLIDRLVIGTSAADSMSVGGTTGYLDHAFGGDGNDSMYAGFSRTSVVLSGDAGDDQLFGSPNNDTLRGGIGNDWIQGGEGNDLIRFLRGWGQDTVVAGNGDVLAMGPDIAMSDLTFVLQGDDVLMRIAGGTDSVLLKALGGWDTFSVRTVDGTTRSGADIFQGLGGVTLAGTAAADALNGTDLPDSLTGGDGSDTLDGRGSNDRLSGQAGDDLLLGGDGNDWLDGGEGNDTLNGGAGRNDLVGGAGADTFVLGGEAGTQILHTDSADVIRFGGGLSSTHVSFVRRPSGTDRGYGYPVDTTIGQTFVSRAASDNFMVFNSDFKGGWSKIEFADGTFINGATGVLQGTDGNDTISYYGEVRAGKGDDLIGFGALQTSQGLLLTGMTLAYDIGDGQDTLQVAPLPSIRNTVRFGAGITKANLKVGADTTPNHASLSFNGFAGGLEVDAIGSVIFADGSVLSSSDLFNLKYTQAGQTAPYLYDMSSSFNSVNTSLTDVSEAYLGVDYSGDTVSALGGNDEMWGQGGDDSLSGGDGNDTLDGGRGNDTLQGDAGADRYVIRAGQGDDLIHGDSQDTLALRGVLRSDVTVGQLGETAADTLVMSFRQGGSVTLDKFSLAPGFKVVFDDGQTLGWTDLTGLPVPPANQVLNGTAKADTLQGGLGNDTLSGLAGNDTLSGGAGNDVLVGGKGNDTYRFARGDGQDTVVENDGTLFNSDLLKFSADIGSRQLWFRKLGNNLEVSVMGSTDKVIVQDWYRGSAYRVEKFSAGDGKSLTATKVDALVNAMAAFTPPATATSLPANAPAALTKLVASSWV